MIRLLKKSFSLSLENPRFHTSAFNLLRFLSSSTSAAKTLAPKSNFITGYLVTSCGLSPQKAAAASKPISRLTSPLKPDSVRHFLKHHGFTDIEIGTIVSKCPQILRAEVEKAIGPKFKSLCKSDFDEHELRKLIVNSPNLLLTPCAISLLDFWKRLLNGDKKQLLSAFARNRNLIGHKIDESMAPKISLLKDYGFSEADIRMIIVNSPGLIIRSKASMEALRKRAQDLGFRPGSPMFVHGFTMLNTITADRFMAKMKLFKGFGWSEEEFLTAVKKFPYFVSLTEEKIREKIREKMEFLVGKVGCTQPYIVSRPMVLNYSLERRMMPRHSVMRILKSEKLIERDFDFFSILSKSEKKFVDSFILRYKKEVPGLLETYTAACAKEIHFD